MRSSRAPTLPVGPILTRAQLAERIRDIEIRTRPANAGVPTGWGPIDAMLGGLGLGRGAIHEWFGLASQVGEADGGRSQRWVPPLLILVHLVGASMRSTGDRMSGGVGAVGAGWVVWIGRRVWPSLHALARGGGHEGVLSRTLFVAPVSAAERLWTIDAALRVPGLVVVADTSGLNMAATRRLQLAAEAGGSLGLFARPMHERGELSAAATRWEVAAAPSASERARWTVHLSRCKGLHATGTHGVVVERSDAGAVVAVPPDVCDRPRQASLAS